MSILIVDVETTGLPSDKDARVIELAAVVLHPHRDYAEVNHFSAVLFPGGSDTVLIGYPRNASQAVPVEEILCAPHEEAVRLNFAAWCKQHQVTEVFSYNRVFDEGMLKRSGFDLPWTGCVMRMARGAMSGLKKDPSLAAAAAHFGITQGEAHRALPDARLAAQVFATIRRKG
jgi:DNA polymerase III epsilon subunit-like protein